jgi:uncharacterized OB-fold protein
MRYLSSCAYFMTTFETDPATHGPGSIGPFLDALARGELVLPHCLQCNHIDWYPEVRCTVCHANRFEWRTLEPVGTVFTSTVLRRELVKGGPPPPVSIALVEPKEAPGCRIVMMRFDRMNEALAPGTSVDIVFQETEGRWMPYAKASRPTGAASK